MLNQNRYSKTKIIRAAICGGAPQTVNHDLGCIPVAFFSIVKGGAAAIQPTISWGAITTTQATFTGTGTAHLDLFFLY